MAPGDVVLIRAFDGVPEHLFRVEEVYEDCISGTALSGALSRGTGTGALDGYQGPRPRRGGAGNVRIPVGPRN